VRGGEQNQSLYRKIYFCITNANPKQILADFDCLIIAGNLIFFGISYNEYTILNIDYEKELAIDLKVYRDCYPDVADDWMADYKTDGPHQGNRCQGKTPIITFSENVLLAKEKLLYI
jgi:hypothetical protein